MKKTAKNLTTSTAQKKSKLDPLSNNNESNLTIDGVDDFVLFPLDVQETNPITQNTTTSQEDDFILFPLDVKKTSTNTNNPVPITNQKTNKPKKQFVTKPYPTNSNNSVNQTPNTPKKQIVAKQKPLIGKSQANPPTPALVNKPLSNKTKILWVFIICIGLYTYFKKESSETYGHFFYKTIKNVSISGYNQFVSLFKDEDDFKKFKLGHKIIYSPYLEYIEDESGEINEVKGDSIILLKPTGKQFRSYFLPSGKPYQIKLNDNEYSEKEHYSNENIYLNIDQESFESRNQNHGVFYSDKTNVVIDDERNYFTQEILVNISDIEYDYTNKVEYEYMRNDIHDFKLNITSKKYFFKNTIFPSIEIDSLTTKNKTRKIVKNSDINIKLYERKNVELDNEGWPINKGNLIIIKDFKKTAYHKLNGNDFIEKIEIIGLSKDISIKIISAKNNKVLYEENSTTLNGTKTYTSNDIFGKKQKYYSSWMNNNNIIIKISNYNKIIFEGIIENINNNLTKQKFILKNKKIINTEEYKNTIKDIISNYYFDLNNNEFDARNYYCNNVEQFINLKNTTPKKINKIKNNNDYIDNYTILDESSIKQIKTNPSNYFSYWSYTVEFNCFRPSKNKHQNCNINIYLGIDENNKIISYVESKVYNLEFFD